MALPVDVTDPGQVNVADQGYPIVPPGFQNLPPNFGALLQASLFAAPIVRPGVQAGTVPRAVAVADQPFRQPSFSRLSPEPPEGPEIDVGLQNPIRLPLRNFIVTDCGNFQSDPAFSQLTLTVVSVIDADTGGAVGANTTRYQIFVSGAVLTDIGLSIQGRQVLFSGNTTVAIQNYVRTIIVFNANSIIVARTEFGTTFSTVQPAAGDTMSVDIERDGDEVVFDTFGTPTNVVINLAPPVAQTVVAPVLGTQGNIRANDGVIRPFIGSGVMGPQFQGTFEVANQVPLGLGLPGNVFP